MKVAEDTDTPSFCPNCNCSIADGSVSTACTCGKCGVYLVRKGTSDALALSTEDREQHVGACAASGMMLAVLFPMMWTIIANPPYRPGMEVPIVGAAIFFWRQIRKMKSVGRAVFFVCSALGIAGAMMLLVLPVVMLGSSGWPADSSSTAEKLMLFGVIGLTASGCVAAVYYFAN